MMIRNMKKKIMAWWLALSLVLGTWMPMLPSMQAQAAEQPLSFNAGSTYTLVAQSTGKALNVKGIGWQTHITADGTYLAETNQTTASTQMKIVPLEDQSDLAADEVKVTISYVGQEEEYPVRMEGNNDYVFADADKRTDYCTYIIRKTGDGQGTIRRADAQDKYMGEENGEVRVKASEEEALIFQFVENPVVADFTLYIEHKATGKFVRADGVNQSLKVDGAEADGVIGDDLRWNAVWGDYNGPSVAFVSKDGTSRWKGGNAEKVTLVSGNTHGGWESIRLVPGGDGTVSFRDTADGKYFTVQDGEIVKTGSTEAGDENGKFIVHSLFAPEQATDVAVKDVEDTSLTVSWTGVSNSIYTGYKVTAVPELASGKKTVESPEVAAESVRLTGLEASTTYEIKVLTVNGESPAAVSETVSVTTKNGPSPKQPEEVSAQEADGGVKVTWKGVDEADHYDIYRAESAYAEYTKIAAAVTETEYTDKNFEEGKKYSSYYRIVAVNENGESQLSDKYASLEKEMFGDHTLIFAASDDAETIDTILQELFDRQNDYNEDAQFQAEHYQVYFKPGDYTETNCMYIGFYTAFNGLGETPYDVKLNNIAVPAYLPAGALGGNGDNATCNFWRSVENLSVIKTGNEQGKAEYGSYRPEEFNWAVAQAAPMRRVYSDRDVSYDWNYGWASGGYVADCLFTGKAGTHSGQQFYTRNSVIGEAFGTTLNNFFQGVQSDSLPDGQTGQPLEGGNGYSNWGIASADGGQQVFTNVANTSKISEKPFLYLDGKGEYQVFVPSIREDASGVSWAENDMGEGTSIPLSDFYIAKAEDTAKTINSQLSAGKHIYFTPGVYHAEEPIRVEKEGTVLLGTGMAAIIPDNENAAMEVADVDGVRVAGLIFDAGTDSRYLLKIGEEGAHTDHSEHPIILQDLFFRIGGTVDRLTTAEDALEINSDDVICDHFWIWRADHGTGVSWDGNAAQHGLIVNGDNVTCYALFNEHFEKYDTLWNGENGATYFYQNEKCYDPVSQEAWMSHSGAVNGYAAYKVANHVKKHYAVGLGIYNVFIYTGESYDSTEVQIQLDNAVEVPNSPEVLVENACIQTFADTDKVMQKFNHIINFVGDGVSSGIDKETGERGEGWARKFLLSYRNGQAVVGKETVSEADKGKFLGVDELENVRQPGDEILDLTALQRAVKNAEDKEEAFYTAESWENFSEALENAQAALDAKELRYASQADCDNAEQKLTDAAEQLEFRAADMQEPEQKNNPYNEWKKTALVSPERGQLIPAGTISVKWNAMDAEAGAELYKVYLDGKLTELLDASEEAVMTYEFYSTETKAHQIQIVAELENGDEVHSNIRTFYVSKKGMSVDCKNVDYALSNMGESWYYNWSTEPYAQYTSASEFVPMVWNGSQTSMDWLNTANAQGYDKVLGFNEPDLDTQANMEVEEAVSLWEQFTDSGLSLGAPVTAQWASSSTWLESFMEQAGEQTDFIPMHLYMGYPDKTQVKAVLDEIKNTYRKYRKPVWVTEIAFASSDPNWTGLDAGNRTYAEKTKEALEMLINGVEGEFDGLEQLKYVERYAWFSFDTNHTQGGVSALYETNEGGDLELGALTELGKLYRSLGNPDGYVLPALDGTVIEERVPQDAYVRDALTKIIIEKGEDGQDGKDGTDGKDGQDGKDGLDGKDGQDGKDGLDGKDGQNGKDGLDGKDGQSGTDGGNGQDGQTVLPAVNSQVKVGTYIYKITSSSADKKTATLLRPVKKNMTKAVLPGVVKLSGGDYQVTAIAPKAFYNNKKLKTVTVGRYTASIGKECFSGCKSLKKITIKTKTLKKVGKNALKGIHKKAVIRVPKAKLKAYGKLLKGKGQKKTVKITK